VVTKTRTSKKKAAGRTGQRPGATGTRSTTKMKGAAGASPKPKEMAKPSGGSKPKGGGKGGGKGC
jgi:hypothetical protein